MWRAGGYGSEIAERIGESGFIDDKKCCWTVAKWAYAQGVSATGIAWVKDNITEPISNQYLDLFSPL